MIQIMVTDMKKKSSVGYNVKIVTENQTKLEIEQNQAQSNDLQRTTKCNNEYISEI